MNNKIPQEQIEKLADLGFMGMMVKNPNTAAAGWIPLVT